MRDSVKSNDRVESVEESVAWRIGSIRFERSIELRFPSGDGNGVDTRGMS